MTLGPAICAAGLLLLSRVGAGATYARDVLPGVVVLGLGLSLTVAPLTAAALGSVDERHAGIASGVNNAVARVAGLLAVAVLPLASGLGSGALSDPAALAPTYRAAMLLCACLLLAAAATAFAFIPSKASERPQVEASPAPTRGAGPSPVRTHCAVSGPPLHPRPGSCAEPAR